jgi:hypothetical protein
VPVNCFDKNYAESRRKLETTVDSLIHVKLHPQDLRPPIIRSFYFLHVNLICAEERLFLTFTFAIKLLYSFFLGKLSQYSVLTTDCATGVRSPSEVNIFSSSLYVHISSEAHPSSYQTASGGPFPAGKAQPGRDANPHPHVAPRSRMSRSYTFHLSLSACMACSGKPFFLITFVSCHLN